MKKLIIIEHEPLTINVKNNFFIDELHNAGYIVEYWDVSAIVHGDLVLADELQEAYVRKIDSISVFEAAVRAEHSNAIFIVEVFEKWNARFIFKILHDFNTTRIRIDTYATAIVPIPLRQKLIYFTSLSYLMKLIGNRLRRKKLMKFYAENGIVLYNTLFTSADVQSTSKTRVIRINSIDYERFLDSANVAVPSIKEKYCVFLDEYLPYHPDTKYLQGNKYVDAGRYLALMNRFFDYIEQEMGLKVVIAGHPKSDYSKDAFNGREIIKYKTSELSKHAEFVVGHCSLSIHYAILNYKPIVFTVFEELRRRSLLSMSVVKFRSEFLAAPVYQLDDFRGLDIPRVDKERYDRYKYTFLTTRETEHRRNKDVLIDYFKSMVG